MENSYERRREVSAPLPKTVYLFMSQHIGAPLQAGCQKGDMVKKGQLVGEAQGFVSANVHASISGKVVDVVPWPHPITGIKVPGSYSGKNGG